MQLGAIITTLVRNLELRIDSMPEPDYHVSIALVLLLSSRSQNLLDYDYHAQRAQIDFIQAA